jgi:transposase-like protein
MQNQKETTSEQTSQNKQPKSNKKKKGKIQLVWDMHEKGVEVKEIAQKTGLKPSIIRSYLWRRANPSKYAELLARYNLKKKERLSQKKSPETDVSSKVEKA